MKGYEIIQQAIREGRFTEIEPKRLGDPLTPVRCIHLTSDERAALDAQNIEDECADDHKDTFGRKDDTSVHTV